MTKERREEEVTLLRQRVAELEAELSFSEKQVQNSLILIAEKDKTYNMLIKARDFEHHRADSMEAKYLEVKAELDKYQYWREARLTNETID